MSTEKAITKKQARACEKEFIACIKDGEAYDTWTLTKVIGKGEDGIVILEVTLQDRVFRCGYTYPELKKVAKIATDVFFELKSLREIVSKEDFKTQEESEDGFAPIKYFCDNFATETLKKSLSELAVATRVGGAHYMLIAWPHFVNVILDLYRVTQNGDYDTKEDFMGILSFVFRAFLYVHRDYGFENALKKGEA